MDMTSRCGGRIYFLLILGPIKFYFCGTRSIYDHGKWGSSGSRKDSTRLANCKGESRRVVRAINDHACVLKDSLALMNLLC